MKAKKQSTNYRRGQLTARSREDLEIRQYCRELVFFGRMLHERHYVSACDGNLSLRLGPDRVLTTPTRMSKGLMRPEDMVVVDMDGNKISGSRRASSEIQMHLTIYKLRPDAGAVVHAHPYIATGFASAGLGLTEPVCSELVMTLGSIPLAPYALPGSPELSDALQPFIGRCDAILMENHGAVAYGRDLLQAYLNMEAVEHCARVMLVARLLGRNKSLNEVEVSRLLATGAKYRGENTTQAAMSKSLRAAG